MINTTKYRYDLNSNRNFHTSDYGGNFSVVVKKPAVSQPAISNSIKKMESELNTSLISRMNEEFTLTEE